MNARLAAVIVPLALMLLACQTGSQMSNSEPIVVSDDLAAALAEFQPFLLADDEERSNKLRASDNDTLRGLAEAVEPLFDEINTTLDETNEASTLSGEAQDLESNLHSLAQAALEARIELDDRGE
jgi:hypothetical protein